jgi:Tfp pilus assembly protein PilF
MRLFTTLVTALCFALVLSTSVPVRADGGGGTTNQTPSPLRIARDLMDKHKYADALVVLEKAVGAEPRNADLLNLTGYAYRELDQLENALVFYNRALAEDPEHKGALNYMGMLYVSTGRMDDAKVLLARLDDACFFSCKEHDELKKAIETGVVPDD